MAHGVELPGPYPYPSGKLGGTDVVLAIKTEADPLTLGVPERSLLLAGTLK